MIHRWLTLQYLWFKVILFVLNGKAKHAIVIKECGETNSMLISIWLQFATHFLIDAWWFFTLEFYLMIIRFGIDDNKYILGLGFSIYLMLSLICARFCWKMRILMKHWIFWIKLSQKGMILMCCYLIPFFKKHVKGYWISCPVIPSHLSSFWAFNLKYVLCNSSFAKI